MIVASSNSFSKVAKSSEEATKLATTDCILLFGPMDAEDHIQTFLFFIRYFHRTEWGATVNTVSSSNYTSMGSGLAVITQANPK